MRDLKLVVLGDAGVGKSAICTRYETGRFGKFKAPRIRSVLSACVEHCKVEVR